MRRSRGADERVRQSQHLNVAFESRQTRLADGLALARAQKYDAAFKAFNGLITPGAKDEAAQAALYDLGNMYLRQAPGAMRLKTRLYSFRWWSWRNNATEICCDSTPMIGMPVTT